MKMIRRVRMARLDFPPEDGSPWVMDYRSFDIPGTVAAAIRNAAPGLVAMTLSTAGGPRMTVAAERAARRRGIRLIWFHRKIVEAEGGEMKEIDAGEFRKLITEAETKRRRAEDDAAIIQLTLDGAEKYINQLNAAIDAMQINLTAMCGLLGCANDEQGKALRAAVWALYEDFKQAKRDAACNTHERLSEVIKGQGVSMGTMRVEIDQLTNKVEGFQNTFRLHAGDTLSLSNEVDAFKERAERAENELHRLYGANNIGELADAVAQPLLEEKARLMRVMSAAQAFLTSGADGRPPYSTRSHDELAAALEAAIRGGTGR